jgi:hypothetical protein
MVFARGKKEQCGCHSGHKEIQRLGALIGLRAKDGAESHEWPVRPRTSLVDRRRRNSTDSFHEVVVNGIAGQIRRSLEIQLVEDA